MPSKIEATRCKRPEEVVRVGAQLRQRRVEIGWTPKYAAARLGLSLDYFTAIERDEPIPKSTYTRIIRIYSRTMHKLTQHTKGVFR